MIEQDKYALFDGDVMIGHFYKTFSNIKASLFIKFGFLHFQKQIFFQYEGLNPELKSIHIPSKYLNMTSNLEIKNRKLNIKNFNLNTGIWNKIDFDVNDYFRTELQIIEIAAKYGYAVKETFRYLLESSSVKYLLLYIPDDYRNENNYPIVNNKIKCNIKFKNLKESDKIKNIIENIDYKVKKITRHGKTAIVLNSFDEIKNIISQLNNSEYIALYYNGNTLNELDKRFYKLVTILK